MPKAYYLLILRKHFFTNMTHNSEYDSIRPYEGKEIQEAVERVRTSEGFLQVFSQLSNVDPKVLGSLLTGIETRYDWHQKVWGPIVDFAEDYWFWDFRQIAREVVVFVFFMILFYQRNFFPSVTSSHY